jgi:hypothetical protein
MRVFARSHQVSFLQILHIMPGVNLHFVFKRLRAADGAVKQVANLFVSVPRPDTFHLGPRRLRVGHCEWFSARFHFVRKLGPANFSINRLLMHFHNSLSRMPDPDVRRINPRKVVGAPLGHPLLLAGGAELGIKTEPHIEDLVETLGRDVH